LSYFPRLEKTLARSNPQEVQTLMKMLDRIDTQQAKPLRPSLLDGPIFVGHPVSFPDRPR
jgi:hypothetical protein